MKTDGCLNSHLLSISDFSSNKIGHAATRKGHIGSRLQQNNFSILVQSTGSGSCTGTSSDSSDNYELHDVWLLLLLLFLVVMCLYDFVL
jgi:hypothetical protein